jgi:four helix bundle protein
MLETSASKPVQYDLEERTLSFARNINNYVNSLPRTISNIENGKQLVRSAGSVGANYIEANESLSRKDFFFRIRIAKKEAKESRFWISLTQPSPEGLRQKDSLFSECTELMKILGSIAESANRVSLSN